MATRVFVDWQNTSGDVRSAEYPTEHTAARAASDFTGVPVQDILRAVRAVGLWTHETADSLTYVSRYRY